MRDSHRESSALLQLYRVSLLAALLLSSLSQRPALADVPFEMESIPSAGRSVAAHLADFDGDGHTDLMVVTLEGIPPREKRNVRIYLQRDDGTLPASPDHSVPMPATSAVYDVADLKPENPGSELVLLRPDRVTLLALGDASGRSWDLPVPGASTIAASTDERGFEPFELVHYTFGAEPWILVPQLGWVTALTADGEVQAAMEVGRRANYFVIPKAGLLSVESDVQLFLDVPKLAIGDVDGDGRTDIVATTRHEIRVFLRKQDGSYSSVPDRALTPGLVSARDHIRGTGGVVSTAADIDGDGRLDLTIAHVQGGFTDATTTTYTYLNHDGSWNLEEPDSKFTEEASLSTNVLIDLDGDRQMELLRIQLRFSLLEVVELLLTQEVDAEVKIHRLKPGVGYLRKAWRRRKVSLPFSFETFRPSGFLPTLAADLNVDGRVDLLLSGSGKELEVFLGASNEAFSRRSAQQKMSTAGVIQFGDLNGDRLPDFVLYDPHHFDIPIQVGRNRGTLRGTPPSVRVSPKLESKP